MSSSLELEASAPPLRGRFGIDCRVVVRPPPGREPRELTLVGAVAAAQAVEDATGLAAQVRWPGDVMLNRRKVAGVLAQPRDGVAVLQIAVNVNQARAELPVGAGSLRTLVGRTYDRAELLGSLLARLEEAYDAWQRDGIRALHTELGPRDFLRGRVVTVGKTEGVAEGIDADGRLIVAGRAFEAGEVTYGA